MLNQDLCILCIVNFVIIFLLKTYTSMLNKLCSLKFDDQRLAKYVCYNFSFLLQLCIYSLQLFWLNFCYCCAMEMNCNDFHACFDFSLNFCSKLLENIKKFIELMSRCVFVCVYLFVYTVHSGIPYNAFKKGNLNDWSQAIINFYFNPIWFQSVNYAEFIDTHRRTGAFSPIQNEENNNNNNNNINLWCTFNINGKFYVCIMYAYIR